MRVRRKTIKVINQSMSVPAVAGSDLMFDFNCLFFMKTADVPKKQLPSEPLYALTLDKIEPIFKGWIKEVLASEQPVEQPLVFYSRYEVCKLLKISLPTLGRYMNLGIVTGKKVGNRILFSQDDIDKALHEINRG